MPLRTVFMRARDVTRRAAPAPSRRGRLHRPRGPPQSARRMRASARARDLGERPRCAPGLSVAALACAGLAGCASLATERNLAPLFSEHSIAGGGVERESFGGIGRVRYTRSGGPLTQWALRPL